MKAIRIHAYGDVNALQYEDAPTPPLLDNDVLIRVVGTSVNPVDWKVRDGLLSAMLKHEMPLTLGWDVSGVVHQVGEKATKFAIGDAVYSLPAIARNGTYAEYVAVNEDHVAMKPKRISHIEAGVLPLAGITAWDALVTMGNVAPGQRVLIHGGGGGVGSLAVQIAKIRGAFVVATGSSTSRPFVESLGADQFVDYRTQTLSNATKDIDFVFDTIGGDTQAQSWGVMARNGLLVSVSSPPSPPPDDQNGLRGEFLFTQPTAAALRELAALVDAGALRPVIDSEFALADMKPAHLRSQTGRSQGKIAIYVGQP